VGIYAAIAERSLESLLPAHSPESTFSLSLSPLH
jgi:hypothetical protein